MPFDSHPAFTRPVDSQWTSVAEVRLMSRSALLQLRSLRSLAENWDSYGSHGVLDYAIEIAASIVTDMIRLDMPEPQIFPVSGGGVQLEWENSTRELEIEIMRDRSIEFLLVDKNNGIKGMFEGQIPSYNLGELVQLVQWFSNGKENVPEVSNDFTAPLR